MKLYKSYNFVDKDPIIDRVRTIVGKEGLTNAEVSVKSGVAVSTLYNWFDGSTKRPQYATVMAVVRALGYKEVFVKRGGKIEKDTRDTLSRVRQQVKSHERRAG